MTADLEPLDPCTAKQMYLDARRHELAEATFQSHRYRLKQFVEWCEQQNLDNLNELSSRDIHRYRVKRRNEDELTTSSMKGQLATLRMYLRFCASIDAVVSELDEKILLPTTTAEDARDELLEAERAHEILDYLKRFRYARLEHALLEVLWNTGLRIGAATGLDIDDYDSDDQSLELVHRPDQGTSLKNGIESERFVAVSESVAEILDDWIAVNHPGTVDEHGRDPLFATNQNRLSRNRGRTIAYENTRHCVYGDECPHDRDIDDCEARVAARAYACPSVVSPHPIRRGAITYHLREDTPERVVSDRMDVSQGVLDKHYDQRSEREKFQQRRRYLPDE